MNEEKRRKPREVWHPPEYSIEQQRAVQALADYAQGITEVPPGPHQMKMAWDWIIYGACQLREEPFFKPGQPDAVHYVLGRQSVARAILKLATVKVELKEN